VNYGNVKFQSYSDASAQGLVYINSAGNAVLKVDNKTVGNPNDQTFGRNSVLLTSNAAVNIGSLILIDMIHAPWGCSVWPAFFTQGAGVTWPLKGEIDIFENVNQATVNQYSLHTLQGCTHPTTSNKSVETGTIVSTDCFNATNGNQGCIVRESQPNSFGSGFNNNGGGALATLFNENGVKQWFFPRASVPSDFNSTSPNPTNWGVPSAYFPSSSCNMDQFFGPQTMILDIDICGAFGLGAFSATCQGNCLDLVRTPTNYDNAWFEIKFIKVFTENSSGGSVTPPIPTSTGAGGSGGGATSSPTHAGAAVAISAPAMWGNAVAILSTVIAATVAALWTI